MVDADPVGDQRSVGEVVTEREVSLNPQREDLKLKLNGMKQQRLEALVG